MSRTALVGFVLAEPCECRTGEVLVQLFSSGQYCTNGAAPPLTQNVSSVFSGGKTSTGEAAASSLFCSWCRRLWGGLLPGYR